MANCRGTFETHLTGIWWVTYNNSFSERAVSRLAQWQEKSFEEGTRLEQGFPTVKKHV
jgi:hypothetical protein